MFQEFGGSTLALHMFSSDDFSASRELYVATTSAYSFADVFPNGIEDLEQIPWKIADPVTILDESSNRTVVNTCKYQYISISRFPNHGGLANGKVENHLEQIQSTG